MFGLRIPSSLGFLLLLFPFVISLLPIWLFSLARKMKEMASRVKHLLLYTRFNFALLLGDQERAQETDIGKEEGRREK